MIQSGGFACEQFPFALRADLVALLLLLPALALVWRYVPTFSGAIRGFGDLGRRRGLAVVVVMLGTALGHLAVRPILGSPDPRIADEFSYLLGADTFLHGRLANPPHPHWQFFETVHVNQQPTYVSMYPPAQSLFLAAGKLAGSYFLGVALTSVLFCGLLTWALQAWVNPIWAFVCGWLAMLRFSLFSYWGNSYWGGFVPALGGVLLLGVVGRLRRDEPRSRAQRSALAAACAAGLLLLGNSRPYEGLVFSLVMLAYYFRQFPRLRLTARELGTSLVLPLVLIGAMGGAWMGYYFWRTTGNPLKMPYVVNQETYAKAPLFVLGKERADYPHYRHPRMAKLYLSYVYNVYVTTQRPEGYLLLLRERLLGLWTFYLGPLFTIPFAIGGWLALRERSRLAPFLGFFAVVIAIAFEVWSHPHYLAPASGAIWLLTAWGLEWLWKEERRGTRLLVAAILASVALMTILRATYPMYREADTCYSDWADPKTGMDGRRDIVELLRRFPGNNLVFEHVNILNGTVHQEYVYNTADIDSQQIVWAGDMGPEKDDELLRYYSDRRAWVLDMSNRRLAPYEYFYGPQGPGLQLAGVRRQMK